MSQYEHVDSIIKEVLETKDLGRLYQLEIEVSQDIALIKKRHSEAETMEEQVHQGGLSVIYHSILSSIKNRIPDLKKDQEAAIEMEKSKDYKFRLAAKYMLTTEQYASIMKETVLYAREIREKAEKHLNKL